MSSLTLLSALCSSLEQLVRFQLGKSICASSACLNRQIERQSNENKSSKQDPGDIREKSDRVGFNAFFTFQGCVYAFARIAARIAAIGMPSFAS